MSKKDEILFLYYEKKEKAVLIAEKLEVSTAYITKVIKTDKRYSNEKEIRKQISIQNRKVQKREWIRNKRKVLKDLRLDGAMEMLHNQASSELSGGRTINNRAFKKWNTSIYEYYSKTKEFKVKREMKSKTSYAVPQKIKWD